MSLEGQKCLGTYQDGANMVSKWRIDNVFLVMRIEKGDNEKRGQLLVDLYSVAVRCRKL